MRKRSRWTIVLSSAVLCVVTLVAFIISQSTWLMEEYYIVQLRSDSTKLQRDAAEALAKIGSVRAIPYLLTAEMTATERRGVFVVGPNESFLLQALRRICIVRRAATLPALKVALEGQQSNMRIIAVNMLSELQGVAVPELMRTLRDNDPIVRAL